MYKDIPISERLDRIGELLAKGVYLCLKKEKEEKLVEEEKKKSIQNMTQESAFVVAEKNK